MVVERERVPALDGLRGIAILMVLVFHLTPFHHATSHRAQLYNGVVGMGWIGVDLFFVLSGFLITGILINSKHSKWYFRNFYARRTLRIFPLYYLIVFVSVVIAPTFFSRTDSRPAVWSGWWWFYLSNIPWSFAGHASLGWLEVFWSLAVEEHFYLLWPAVVLCCSARTLTRVCLALILTSWVCRAVCAHFACQRAGYSLTPCRMDSLAYGALVAIAIRTPNWQRFVTPVGWTAVGLAVGAIPLLIWRHSVVLDGKTQLFTMPLIDAACALLLLVVVSEAAPLGFAVLRSRALRLLGKYSYGIYVFHLPVAYVVRPHITPLLSHIPSFANLSDLCSFAVLASVVYAIAFASWHMFELPFVRLKRYFPQSHSVPMSV